MNEIVAQINAGVAAAENDILRFFREIVAIPSMDSDIAAVGERIGKEMRKLRFDDVYTDGYGSIVGRIGNGPTVLLFDSHIDTVGIGDRSQWEWDPFEGKVVDGNLYARGALDEKGSTPGMIYGMALARDLGLLDGFTLYYLGNIEEWCDGVACNAFAEWEGIRPNFVVIGEPTKMTVYRGHKGRLELEVVCKGKSAHAASNYLGDNAIYKMLPVIDAIDKMGPSLRTHEFLGQGRITVTRISSVSPSDNAVPDECRIFIDRRVTFGDTKESVIAEIDAILPADKRQDFEIRELLYEDPSHTGAVFAYEKYFPAWALDEDHPLVEAGQAVAASLWGEAKAPGKWDFSTNGNYWAGREDIPSIGFGPGDEIYAHTVNEHVPLAEVVEATKFYALLPHMLAAGKDSN
ncbi:MAG: YgeY family selenium metabolism-linked hydrolase [Caldilineales bacterium]|nr:YgeY family selenium metabolism-linked hydrolase [Caldilineales bacterium]